jgi:hypothetical protein
LSMFVAYISCAMAYLIDVLALKFFEKLGQTFLVGIDTNGGQNALDVVGGGRAVASKAEE